MMTNSESERCETAGTDVFSARIVLGDHGQVVLQAMGELDLAGAATMEEMLSVACSVPAETVEVDASALTFLDVVALGVLLEAHERLLKESRGLSVRGAVGIVRRVFEITGLTSLLDDGDRAIPSVKLQSGLAERELSVARRRTDMSIEEVFVSYFSLGGTADHRQMVGHLREGGHELGIHQRDILAHAVNECLYDLGGTEHLVSYPSEWEAPQKHE